MNVHLAMLKRPLPGLKHRLAHAVGSRIDHTIYSHSNLAFGNGLSGSAWSGRGVDLVEVAYDAERWDFYTLPGVSGAELHRELIRLRGAPYDHFGVMRFGLPLLAEHPRYYFCHELIAALLGWTDAWRTGPGALVARCKDTLGAQLIPIPFPHPLPAI